MFLAITYPEEIKGRLRNYRDKDYEIILFEREIRNESLIYFPLLFL
jgi:hypothetical protein